MFYVYSAYVSPDNYDSSEVPTYTMSSFNTEAELVKFKMEFEENLNNDCSNAIFRIIEGKELQLTPVEKSCASSRTLCKS